MAVASSSAVAVVQVALGPYIFVFFRFGSSSFLRGRNIKIFIYIFEERKKNSFSWAAAQRSQCIEFPGNTLQRANLFYYYCVLYKTNLLSSTFIYLFIYFIILFISFYVLTKDRRP